MPKFISRSPVRWKIELSRRWSILRGQKGVVDLAGSIFIKTEPGFVCFTGFSAGEHYEQAWHWVPVTDQRVPKRTWIRYSPGNFCRSVLEPISLNCRPQRCFRFFIVYLLWGVFLAPCTSSPTMSEHRFKQYVHLVTRNIMLPCSWRYPRYISATIKGVYFFPLHPQLSLQSYIVQIWGWRCDE